MPTSAEVAEARLIADEEFREAIRTLDPFDALVASCIWDGLTIEETARKMHIHRPTVRKILLRVVAAAERVHLM